MQSSGCGIAVKTAKRTKVYVHAFQRVARGQGGEQPLVASAEAKLPKP